MNPSKVLIADDDFDIRELLRFLLESEGYDVVTAGNGFEALGAAVAEQPDLVVLDVMMPGENGYRVCRGIRESSVGDEEWTPRLPIILLTARDLRDDPERERAFLKFSDADEIIYKPFDGAYVTSRIHDLLSGRQREVTTGTYPRLKLTEVDLGSLNHRPSPSLLPTAGEVWNPSEMWLS